MNLDDIARLVHELAKGPNGDSILLSQLKSIQKITTSEFNTITKTFSRVELSGNTIATSMEPALYWT